MIASKAWIGVIAFALIGIVALQLFLLQLNRSIGRDLARETVLQQQNAALSVENSELAIGERIQREASGLGMTLIPTGGLRFLGVHHGASARAAAALSAPVPQAASSENETRPAGAGERGESPGEASTAGTSAASREGTTEGTTEGTSEGTTGEAARASSPEASNSSGAGASERSERSERGEHTEHTERTEGGSETHAPGAGEASRTEATTPGGTGAAPTG